MQDLKPYDGNYSSEQSKDMLAHGIEGVVSDVGNDFNDQAAINYPLNHKTENCWMSLNAKQHFNTMDNIDERYRKVRRDYRKQLGAKFDRKMLNSLLQWRGVARREAFETNGKTNQIPAGLNLGGYCMMKMKDSVLFFHRIKLRNQTNFRINFLHTDVENMVLVMRLSLNDLHLLGAYERSPVDKDPSVLFYAPTFGEVEFLLKNVNYKMVAQLRLLNNKLIIELVTSKMNIEDILMMYINRLDNQKPTKLLEDNIADFLDRMKTDLDKWLMDYFNDYLTYFSSLGAPSAEFSFSLDEEKKNHGMQDKIDPSKPSEFDALKSLTLNPVTFHGFYTILVLCKFLRNAEKEKIIALNEYADFSLDKIRNRLRRLGGDTIKIPHFTIFGPNQIKLVLNNGALRGLDSIYRRSVTTTKKENDIRKVNLIVGFSNLKVMYNYEASLAADVPPLSGIIVLSADEITAHMELSLLKDPETVDLEFDFIQQIKPEYLTVEGPASRMIVNFKHLLEHHIIAIMSNAVIHNIKMMRTITRCEPMLISQYKSGNIATLSKINAKHNILVESSEIDLHQNKFSKSDSDNDIKPDSVNTHSISKNYVGTPTEANISDILPEEISVPKNNKYFFQKNSDVDGLFENSADEHGINYNSKDTDEINAVNSSELFKDINVSHEDDQSKIINSLNINDNISSADSAQLNLDNKDSQKEDQSLNESSKINASNEYNSNNTVHSNLDDGLMIYKNDSVELKWSETS